MRRALVLSLLALAGACSRGSSNPGPIAGPHVQPEPPPGTGAQAIDMEGEWLIFEVERLDDPTAPSPLIGAPTFLPVQVGQLLEVVNGQLRDETGAPLYEVTAPGAGDFYANVNDGRTLWFEVDDFEPQPASQFFVQAIFGSAGENTIEGFVSVLVLGAPIQGQFEGASPNGSFRVRAGRVASATAAQPVEQPSDQPSSAR